MGRFSGMEISSSPGILKYCRGVSGLLKVEGQVVIQVLMRRGSFYSAKKWRGGGAIAPLAPPFTYAPVLYKSIQSTYQMTRFMILQFDP